MLRNNLILKDSENIFCSTYECINVMSYYKLIQFVLSTDCIIQVYNAKPKGFFINKLKFFCFNYSYINDLPLITLNKYICWKRWECSLIYLWN